MLTWGIAWTSAKIVNQYLNYNNLVFLRFFIGFISMIPFLINRKINFNKISIYTYLNIIITSVLFFIYNQCFFIGTDIGRSGMGGVFVTTTNPVITFIIISIINFKINTYQIISIFLGVFGGLFILDVYNTGLEAIIFDGNIYFIFCSLSWGIMTIIMSNGQKNIDSIWYITFCYLFTSFIALFFIDINGILNYSIYDSKFILNFFLVSAAMSYGTSIYIIASYRLGPLSASSFIFSVPFIAMGTANIFLNEPLGTNVIIGGILSLISIIMINNTKKYKKT